MDPLSLVTDLSADKNELIIFYASHPLLDPDAVIFLKNSWTLRDRGFSTVWLVSLDKVIISSWKIYHKCSFEQGSPRLILEVIQIQNLDLDRIHLANLCGGVQSPSAVVVKG